jgi:hypothetical protein
MLADRIFKRIVYAAYEALCPIKEPVFNCGIGSVMLDKFCAGQHTDAMSENGSAWPVTAQIRNAAVNTLRNLAPRS